MNARSWSRFNMASVVLGFLDPDRFLGGGSGLDAAAAGRVLESLGERLGVDALRAAEGVHRVVNTQMAEGIRLATVRRGVDPRRFALLGFGGAAGVRPSIEETGLAVDALATAGLARRALGDGALARELQGAVARGSAWLIKATEGGERFDTTPEVLTALYRFGRDDTVQHAARSAIDEGVDLLTDLFAAPLTRGW